MAIEKRIKFAGDVFDTLMKKGWSCTDAANFLNSFPDADAVEVVHGQWVCPDFDFSDYWKCSACNEEFYFEDDPTEIPCNYCPNCGAKMDGGSHETD